MAKEIATKEEWKRLRNEKITDYMDRISEVWDKIMKSGNYYYFPVADGSACYEIVKKNPLTLRHVPIGDEYRMHPAMLRGLTMTDVKQLHKFDKLFL